MTTYCRLLYTSLTAISAICISVTPSALAQTASRLSGDLAPNEDVRRFRVLQDGSISYEAGLGPALANEVWHVAHGKSPTLLSGGTGRGLVGVGFNEISPDGAYVYFTMGHAADPYGFTPEIYRTPVSGGVPEPVLQYQPEGASRSIDYYAIGFSPDQSEFLYASDVEQQGVRELYARSLASGVTRRVTPPRPSNGSIQSHLLTITPDGLNVVFPTHYENNSPRELWTVPLAGGNAVQLNAGLPNIHSFTFAGDGDGVLFSSIAGIYQVPLAGGAPTLLSAPASADGLRISPGGERIAYSQAGDVYGVAVDGGPTVRYTSDGQSKSDFPLFFTPDGERLIYIKSGQIHSVDSLGGEAINLTSNHSSFTNYAHFHLTNTDGNLGVLYRIETSSYAPQEIYRVGLDGQGHTRLNMPLGETNAVRIGKFSLTPDGQFLVFGVVDKAQHGYLEASFHMTPVEGGPIVKITPQLPAWAGIKEYQLSSDGSRFYFIADAQTLGTNELFVSGMPMSRLAPGADVVTFVNGGLDLVGGVAATFEEVQARSFFTASYTPGLIPLELSSAPGTFHQWLLDLTGQVADGAALTFRYALPVLQSAGDDPTPTVYMKSPGGAWSPVDPALVAFQPGQFTVNLNGVSGVTIGLAISTVPEPTSLLLAPLAALVPWAARRRVVAPPIHDA